MKKLLPFILLVCVGCHHVHKPYDNVPLDDTKAEPVIVQSKRIYAALTGIVVASVAIGWYVYKYFNQPDPIPEKFVIIRTNPDWAEFHINRNWIWEALTLAQQIEYVLSASEYFFGFLAAEEIGIELEPYDPPQAVINLIDNPPQPVRLRGVPRQA
jgi:hypothetical protein